MTDYYYNIADMADILHRAASIYMSANLSIDYGTGVKYTPIEVHMLKYIINHPGKSTTELSRDWDKTKAAMSQMMKKLEQKGLVHYKAAPDSEKKQLYYATEKGLKLNEAHSRYDTKVFGKTLELLKEKCSKDDIEQCFHVLEEYIQCARQKHYRSK